MYQSHGKAQKKAIFRDSASIIILTRSLNKVILGDYNRPNRIVQINVLHDIYSVIVIYDAKVVYETL